MKEICFVVVDESMFSTILLSVTFLGRESKLLLFALFKNNTKLCAIFRLFTVKLWCRTTVCVLRKDQAILERSCFFFPQSDGVTHWQLQFGNRFRDISKSGHPLM